MEHSEQPLQIEHAYNVRERQEARRKLNRAKTAAVGALFAVGGLMLGGEALQQPIAQPTEVTSPSTRTSETINKQEEKYAPDSFYSGKVEIIMSDNLNIRTSPKVGEETNVLSDWGKIKEIKDANIQGQESFSVIKPLIIKGEDPNSANPNSRSEWIVLDAKVDDGLGQQYQRLFVNFSQQTSDYVKPVESGIFIDLHGYSLSEDLGKVEVPTK